MKHTPEPWNANNCKTDPDSKAVAIWYDSPFDPNEHVFICTGDSGRENWNPDEETIHANMLRIVACVNACKGISNEDLCNGVVARNHQGRRKLIADGTHPCEGQACDGNCNNLSCDGDK